MLVTAFKKFLIWFGSVEGVKNDPNLTAGEKISKIADLKIYIEDRAKHNRQFVGKRLTTNGFEGWEADTKLDRIFANLGMSAEDLADEYDLDADELRDPNNWENGIFKGKYEFNFTYTGAIFREL